SGQQAVRSAPVRTCHERCRRPIFLAPGGEKVYVADSKYKMTTDGFGREADYYQLLAYTTALMLPEGLLVYCQHDGPVPPREVIVGPEGKRLATWALRLDGSIDSVEHELGSLAD